MTKTNSIYKLLLVLMIISIFCTSCSNTGVESGFEFFSFSDESCESNQFHCGYKTERTEFDIDDVTIDLYYGGEFYDYEFEPEYQEHGLRIPSFDIYAASNWDRDNKKYSNEQLIKHVEEDFISEKYDCEIIRNKILFWRTTQIIYNHYETITIPKELFVESSGSIHILIRGTDQIGTPLSIISTLFYYKVVGETVLLSGQSFK